MAGFPSTPLVKIEWVAGSGTFTDITSYVDMGAGIQTRYGRGNPLDQPQAASLTLRLKNQDGRFTPGTQLLADGVTAHPYYPNVVPRRRIQVTFVDSTSTTQFMFYGYVRGWPPNMDNGLLPYVTINASCRLYLVQQTDLKGWFESELRIQNTNLIAYYPMSDAAPFSGLGSASFADISGNNAPPLRQPYIGQFGIQAVDAGGSDPMPQSEGATGASFEVTDGSTQVGVLQATLPVTLNGTAVGFWATFPASVSGTTSELTLNVSTRVAGIQYVSVRMSDTGSGLTIAFGEAGTSGAITYLGNYPITTGVPHYVQFIVQPTTPHPFQMFLYVDGVQLGAADILDSFFPLTQIQFGFTQESTPAVAGPIILGPVLVAAGTFGAGTVPSASHLYSAGTGWAGQVSGDRVTKLLTYAGYTDMLAIETGAAVMSGEQTIVGRSALDCIQEVVDTEGGGSVFYTRIDGYLRFHDRNHRGNALVGTASLTLDATKDITGKQYSPAYDDTGLIVSCTVTRPGGATQTYTDPVATAKYQSQSNDQVTSYASTDADALALAQWRVAAQQPAFRTGQLAVTGVTSPTATIYDQLGVTQTGQVIELNTLAAGKSAPSSLVRMFAEGWSDNFVKGDQAQFTRIYDTSPALYPLLVADDAIYGRVVEDAGSWTLTTTITNSATSISLTTAATHPVMTNTGGDLPLYIGIGTEILQVTAVSGSSSPQTLTVVRGQLNTRAAAQTSGSAITTWTGALAL